MDSANKAKDAIVNLYKGDGRSSVIFKAVLAVIAVVVGVTILKKAALRYSKWSKASPWLLKATKDGKKRMIILQDPLKEGSKPVFKSENQFGGLEFSYVFWIYIDDWSYKFGQWKHVLHKGNDSSWPLRAPGVWLHPNENAIRVYMNTFKNIGEFADLHNIPLGKWFHVAICCKQRNLDIYMNGNLAKRHVLSGLPKQNWGDIYLNSFRGFSGYLSNIRYYNWYIPFSELDRQLSFGPSKGACVDTHAAVPPYFASNWWANQK